MNHTFLKDDRRSKSSIVHIRDTIVYYHLPLVHPIFQYFIIHSVDRAHSFVHFISMIIILCGCACAFNGKSLCQFSNRKQNIIKFQTCIYALNCVCIVLISIHPYKRINIMDHAWSIRTQQYVYMQFCILILNSLNNSCLCVVCVCMCVRFGIVKISIQIKAKHIEN